MPLASGTRLGPYEILAPIGAGGMGEVYRAADTKLGRQVAIKVIPESFAQDLDRMARFVVISPDGKHIGYHEVSAETGRGAFHTYVRPFPAGATGGGKWQISTTPGRFPIWSRSGKELFYETLDGRIMVAEYTAQGDTFTSGRPRQWCDTPVLMTNIFQNYDLAPDGKRFVVLPAVGAVTGGEKTSLHLIFLLNFFDELKRRLPAAR